MKIDFTNNNGNVTVSLDGRLDTASSPELESFLSDKFGGMESLTFDCEKLIYVSSAGLRVFLMAQKKMRSSMKLVNVCELVMEVFEITGFTEILTIE